MELSSVVVIVCASYCLPMIVSFFIGVFWATRRLEYQEMGKPVFERSGGEGKYRIKE